MKKAVFFIFICCIVLFGYNALLYGAESGTCNQPPLSPTPGGDNPDETFAVDAGNPPIEPAFISDEGSIIFKVGYYEALKSLLNKTKSSYIEADFDTSAADILNSSKLLVIPSGGLYGLENSIFFKASLDEYVKQGGTLVIFAQQHGYEFNALPVPQEADGSYRTISGYGWTEDQSCFANAVYIDTQHQMLSSISKSTPTLSVDGYFTDYPSNTTVILRRTANGQPAMIMYDYGQGKVIVTSMYSDFAYSHSQASSEEIALVRDMISWAKQPATLPEIKPGETVSVNLEIKNITTIDAISAKLLINNPDRTTVVSEQTVSVNVPAGIGNNS